MPTAEQMALRHDKVVAAVNEIREHGLNVKKIPANIRGSVLAMALAEKLVTASQIPPKLAIEVSERFLKEEPARVLNNAAYKGTDVHDLVERLDNGEIVDIPDMLAGHIASWRQCKNDYGFVTLRTEFTVFSPTHDYAGTGDFLGTSTVHPEWGLILGDYKTSESGIWPDIALQLAGIKNADFIGDVTYDADGNKLYNEITGELEKIQTFIGIQITAKGYKVVPVNVTDGTFAVFLSAINVARWKTEFEQWALGDAYFVPVAAA